jgi:hypothetical protein
VQRLLAVDPARGRLLYEALDGPVLAPAALPPDDRARVEAAWAALPPAIRPAWEHATIAATAGGPVLLVAPTLVTGP